MVKITEIPPANEAKEILQNAQLEKEKLEQDKERKAKQEVSQKNKIVKTFCQQKIGQDKVVVFTTSNDEQCAKVKVRDVA